MESNEIKKNVVIGILAHVDAGKTTLSESMLYLSKQIKNLGRVDNQDAYLDYDQQERNRGITIFSKLAYFPWGTTGFNFIDTPGHSDFSSEMERTLSVLDYAILVISATDGVQSHTKTIWDLLKHYSIPTFIFVNKVDLLPFDRSKEDIMEELKKTLSDNCIDYIENTRDEELAMVNDQLLNEYMEEGSIQQDSINSAFADSLFYPCFFGSALKVEKDEQYKKSLEVFLNHLDLMTIEKKYPDAFSAKVYKLTRDENGNRLTHLKVTGGTIHAKDSFDGQKVDTIRIYKGAKYDQVNEVKAGGICAVKGLTNYLPGDVIGEDLSIPPVISSFMNYRIQFLDGTDPFDALDNLKILEEEDPTLHLQYDSKNKEIKISLMGAIQIEVLKNVILERFGYVVDFDEGSIIYKETIKNTVEGIGHYEPLRHYAEVHLLLEPLPRDSGLKFVNKCKDEILTKNFQRLIMTHLQEKEHVGILTGSPITDMKISLLAGKSSIKHTVGGDFRQSTYRAIRHGLLQNECILLEPYYEFELTVPVSNMSKAIFDLENMGCSYTMDQTEEEVILKGKASIKKMNNYHVEVLAYTKGKGHLSTSFCGYQECENADEVIKEINYDYESDLENPSGSIFCYHGAGAFIPWQEVVNHMHLESFYQPEKTYTAPKSRPVYSGGKNLDEELEAIFTQTYGKIERKNYNKLKSEKVERHGSSTPVEVKPECILVDGYNVIHAWSDLNQLASESFDSAREKLIDYMASYQGYRDCLMIVVFDAYRVKGGLGSKEKRGNIHVVYTKEAQTADSYIEKATHEMSSQYRVRVATSDNLEQVIVLGSGGYRISSREFELEVKNTLATQLDEYRRKQKVSKDYLLENINQYQED